MAQPGFKTLHMPDVDFRSTCLTFAACLKSVRDWSATHPDHTPILIMLELSRRFGRDKPPARR